MRRRLEALGEGLEVVEGLGLTETNYYIGYTAWLDLAPQGVSKASGLEMSRQRIRFGVVESSTHKCPTCNGTGLVRSVESVALMVMRNVEDHVRGDGRVFFQRDPWTQNKVACGLMIEIESHVVAFALEQNVPNFGWNFNAFSTKALKFGLHPNFPGMVQTRSH